MVRNMHYNKIKPDYSEVVWLSSIFMDEFYMILEAFGFEYCGS